MILERIADFVTELMQYDPTKILIGRENATQETFKSDYIVIDNLTPATPLSTSREYDGNDEIEKFDVVYSGKFTFEFYGDNAHTNMYKFLHLQNTQTSRDLQKKYGITVYKSYSVNNLKQIAGSRYYERYEVEITIQYCETLEVDTLRIDEVVLDKFLTNN